MLGKLVYRCMRLGSSLFTISSSVARKDLALSIAEFVARGSMSDRVFIDFCIDDAH